MLHHMRYDWPLQDPHISLDQILRYFRRIMPSRTAGGSFENNSRKKDSSWFRQVPIQVKDKINNLMISKISLILCIQIVQLSNIGNDHVFWNISVIFYSSYSSSCWNCAYWQYFLISLINEPIFLNTERLSFFKFFGSYLIFW